MAKIQLTGHESIKDALRRFKKICDKEGIINHSKRIAYYEKPSEKRRREESRRIKNIKRAQRISREGFQAQPPTQSFSKSV